MTDPSMTEKVSYLITPTRANLGSGCRDYYQVELILGNGFTSYTLARDLKVQTKQTVKSIRQGHRVGKRLLRKVEKARKHLSERGVWGP